MKKGLTHTDLMVLKRVPNQAKLTSKSKKGGTSGGEGIINRQASGMCFDFPHGDSSTYLAGTEDGIVHKCSCSYNEQYLDSFYGHGGPVYKIRCSPFEPDAFVTCSADWTVKLWHQKKQKPLLSFQVGDLTTSVMDVVWSPHDSVLFGSVTADGRIQLWDLANGGLDPCISQQIFRAEEDEARDRAAAEALAAGEADPTEEDDDLDSLDKFEASLGLTSFSNKEAQEAEEEKVVEPKPKKLSCLAFSNKDPVLITGDADGNVDVYRVHGMDRPPFSDQEQQVRLAKAMFPEDA